MENIPVFRHCVDFVGFHQFFALVIAVSNVVAARSRLVSAS